MHADLSAVAELEARHLNVLHAKLGITTPEALMRADRRVVHASMSRVRPRPTLEDVSRWQDRARDLVPPGPTLTEPGWDQVAAFVVSYEESGSDRRVVVAQAEHVAPEPPIIFKVRVGDFRSGRASAECGRAAGSSAGNALSGIPSDRPAPAAP